MSFFLTLMLLWACAIVAKGFPHHSLGVLFVYSNSSRYNSTEALDGVQDAIEDIENEDVLSGYELIIKAKLDAKCNESSTIKKTLNYITNPILSQPLLAIIGGGCSPVTDTLIDIAEYQNILLISYTPDTVKQSMNYYQLHPSDEPVIQTLATVIKFYGWSRISIITEVEKRFLNFEHQLRQSLAIHKISVLNVVHVWSNENVSDIKDLFVTDARILFLNTFADTSRKVLCEVKAYSRGIYYPDYGWLLHGWYNEDWLLSDPSVHCTTQQLTKVVERGIVVQQYTEEDKRSSISSYGYDAVWSLALALNSTLNMINDNTVNKTLCIGPFTPLHNRSSGTDCLLRYNLLNTEFTGKSCIVIGLLTEYATVNITSNDIVYLTNENNFAVWPVGLPPDGSPIQVIVYYSTTLVVIMYLWASLGIIFSIICFIFTILFRKRKIVRLTSPNLNYFIIIGVFCLYSSTFIAIGVSESEAFWEVSCSMTIWAQCVGVTLFFSPILVKMMRIYYIFSNPTSKKKVLTDKHLLIIVLIIVSIMILLLTIGTAIPQTRPGSFYVEDLGYRPKKNEKGILVEYYGLNCYSQVSFIWIIVIIIYLGVLELIAVILAIKTRNVTIKAINDSKDVIDIVFIVAFASIAMLVFSYLLQDYSNIGDGLYMAALLSSTTGTITLTFIPKMRSLYKDPDGKNVFEEKEHLELKVKGIVMPNNVNQESSIQSNASNDSIGQKQQV